MKRLGIISGVGRPVPFDDLAWPCGNLLADMALFSVEGIGSIVLSRFVCFAFLLVTGCYTPDPPAEDRRSEPIAPVLTSPSSARLAQIPGLDGDRFYRFLAPILNRQDPRQDGWETEVAAEVIADQLKSLGQLIADPAQIDPGKLKTLATDDFSAPPLRPQDTVNVSVIDGSLAVLRAKSASSAGGPIGNLEDCLRRLVEPLSEAQSVDVRFKVFHIEQTAPDQLVTTAYYQLSGHREWTTRAASRRCRHGFGF